VVKGKTGGGESELMGPVVAVGKRLDGGHVWTHPRMIGADGEPAGQGRRQADPVLEARGRPPEPGRGHAVHEWKPQDILNAAPNVDSENTNYLGRGKKYSRFMVRAGDHLPGYDLNHSYEDCDVFISLAR